MNTLRKDWDDVKRLYSPDRISDYVEKGLERMYFGTAPTLGEINANYGADKYEGIMAMLINEIFKFAGLKDKFDEGVMSTVAHTIRTEYPWLKITELMHFVYLFRLGSFDKFYGKPNAATLMQMLRQYIKVDREKLKAEFIAKREHEERILELTQMRHETSAANAAYVAAEIANMLSEDVQAQARWRYKPYGTALSRAYFVDALLSTYPGDMTDEEQYRWASEHAAYVEQHPNLNIVA